MNNDCAVSVIIPVYNSEKYLKECLDSVFEQSLENFEVICVNDASTDGSLEIMESYMKRYLNMRIFSLSENRGQAYARNKGIYESRGEYIYFLDSDDLMFDKFVLKKLLMHAETEQVDGIIFDSQIIYETDELREKWGDMKYLTDEIEKGEHSGSYCFKKMISDTTFAVGVWRQFWKKSYLIEHNLTFQADTAPHEDLLFSFQTILGAKKILYLPESYHIYRIRENSSTTVSFSKKRFLAYCRCYFESMHYIEKMELDMDIEGALLSYFTYIKRYIYDNLVELVALGEDLLSNDTVSVSEKVFLRMILLADYSYIKRIFRPKEYKALVNSKEVIVYGAGKTAKEVMHLLEKFGIYEYKVAVTNKGENLTLEKHELYEIAELVKYRKDSVVIIAVTSKYKYEMEQNLKRLGYENYLYLSEFY